MAASSNQLIPDVVRQWLTLLAILGTFAVNVWSNIYPLNGLNIGEISNTLFSDVLVTPANYAFSIWGVIYLGLLAFGIYQLLPSQRHDPILQRVDYFLIFACIAQAAWVFLFLLRQFWGSVAAMAGILLLLIGAYVQLRTGQRRITRSEKWCAQIPFSIYLGWISVATIVNVALALYSIDWNGFGISPRVWAVIVLIIGAAIAGVVATRRRDIAYPLVIIWALLAIAVRQTNTLLVQGFAIGLAVLLALLVIAVRFRKPLNQQA